MTNMDLPFEPSDPTPLVDNHVHYSGGLVVAASTVELADGSLAPGLVFRFAQPDGSGFYSPVVLVLDPQRMKDLPDLIGQAADHARRGAAEGRRA